MHPMFQVDAGILAIASGWAKGLAGNISRARRGKRRRKRDQRPPSSLAVECLEERLNLSAPMVVSSFFDSAVYEFDSSSGALLATLVAPYSSSILSGPAGMTLGPDSNLYISSQFNN